MTTKNRRCIQCTYSAGSKIAETYCVIRQAIVKADAAETCRYFESPKQRKAREHAALKNKIRFPYLHEWMILEAIDACMIDTPHRGATPAEIWNRINCYPSIKNSIAGNPEDYTTCTFYWEHVKEKCDDMTARGTLYRHSRTCAGRIISHYARIENKNKIRRTW